MYRFGEKVARFKCAHDDKTNPTPCQSEPGEDNKRRWLRRCAARPVEAPMARLGSPGCHVDVCLRRGAEEAGLVVSTSLPQPAAFEQLRRRENEILKSSSQTLPKRLLQRDQAR